MNFRYLLAISSLLLLAACPSPTTSPGDDDDDSTPYPEVETYDFEAASPWYACPDLDSFPEEATVVTVMDQADQNFGGENLRSVTADLDLPAGDWAQVGMWFELTCPESGLCDHWDRTGSVQLLRNPEAEPEDREYVELLRHITAYRMPTCQYVDITPLARELQGSKQLESFIDTWVGPGHSDGDGWRTTVRFVFTPGEPAGADEVINIWGRRSITVGERGEGQTVDDQVEPVTVDIPADASRVVAHLTTTGHSFGNTNNCAEFCQMRHDVVVNEAVHSWSGWRADCDSNPVSPQPGTWQYPRNGWCPGAVALGGQLDITEAVVPGETATIDFDILMSSGFAYVNSQPVDLRPSTVVSLKLYTYSDD